MLFCNANASRHPRLVQVYGDTAALFHALHALLFGGRLLVRAIQSQRHGGKSLWFTERARLEGSLLFADMSGDVKRIALSVAEPINNGAANAAFLVDGLLQWLGLAPVEFEVSALGDMQSLLAGLQHLVGGQMGALLPSVRARARLWRLGLLLGFVRVVFVRMRDGTLASSVPFGIRWVGEKSHEEKHAAQDTCGCPHP